MHNISDKNGKGRRATHTAYMRFRHFVKSGYWRGHHIHSPFVYHMVRDVITTRTPNDREIRERAEEYRRALYADDRRIMVRQMGAVNREPRLRKICDIAKRTSTTEKYGRLLARIARELEIDSILELGTSMGISTAYLALSRPGARVVTIEGVAEVAEVAEARLKEAGINNVTVLRGDIDEKIDEAIAMLPRGEVGLAFIDGNHSKDATLRNFEKISAHRAALSVLIFDDIYWSDGMTTAWNTIVADSRVSTTIELAQMGLAIFRSGCQKEHYNLRW